MILPFSTHLNGEPTHFPEKIVKSLIEWDLMDDGFGGAADIEWYLSRFFTDKEHPYQFNRNAYEIVKPKNHTIRHDKNHRWHCNGLNIHFTINNRSKSMYRFAPIIPVVSTQIIEIKHYGKASVKNSFVMVNGLALGTKKIQTLAVNDGFQDIDCFLWTFQKFYGNNFNGKIIHWTDVSY